MNRWWLGTVAVLLLLCTFEARTIRQMKSELDALRQRPPATAPALAGQTFTPEFRDEVARTLDWLNQYYASPQGLNYPQGLCLGGRLDTVGISTWVFGTYLPLRAGGASEPMARQKVIDAIAGAVRGRPPA